jgi:hypothetical protein
VSSKKASNHLGSRREMISPTLKNNIKTIIKVNNSKRLNKSITKAPLTKVIETRDSMRINNTIIKDMVADRITTKKEASIKVRVEVIIRIISTLTINTRMRIDLIEIVAEAEEEVQEAKTPILKENMTTLLNVR